MPDYEKLIDTNHPNFSCVCFCNSARLTINQITEIFSQFGKIASVNCASIKTGFHFVRYRSLEEARRCVTELDGHPQITLRPVKSRFKVAVKKNPANKFNKNQSGDLVEGDNQAEFLLNAKQDTIAGSTKSNQSSVKSKSKDTKRRNKENGSQNGSASFSNDEPCEDHSDNMEEFLSVNQSPSKTLVGARLARKLPSNEAQDKCENVENCNNQLNATKFAELQKHRGINADTFKPQKENNFIETCKRFVDVPAVPAAFMPPSIISSSHSSLNSGKEQFMTNDMPPPLIGGSDEKRRQIVLAGDVVVANIHSNLGIVNIYQILRDFSPIHISDIETVPEINIRFCYVYFKTPTDAINVEQVFDGITVCGKQLIILRSHILEAEANVF